jgi:capsular exopolysaccharide synthesis family protein
LIGLLIPTIYVALKEFLVIKVEGVEMVKSLIGIPFLGVIGHHDTGAVTPVIDDPKSAISEAFRSLRVNMEFLGLENAKTEKKIIGLTSSVSGEGKTFCALNIASSHAITGKKVVLLGCDLRKPKLGDDLEGLNLSIGMSSVLSGNIELEKVIQQTGIENLDIILSGPIPPNPGELLGSEKMASCIGELKDKYDVVIIDSPPVGIVSDYLTIRKFTNYDIFVIRNKYTSAKALSLLQKLETGDKTVVALLNDVKNSFGSNGYGYGYSYGYGYGQGYYEEGEKQGLFGRFKKKIKGR